MGEIMVKHIYIYLRNVVEGVCGPNGGLQIAGEYAGL